MANDYLELFSFEHDETWADKEQIYYLCLPKCWQEFIEQGKEDYKLKMKPTNLGRKLQALFPDIFHVSWRNDEPWLLADKKVETAFIKALCLNWFAKVKECATTELPIEIQQAELVWVAGLGKELYSLYKENSWKFSWVPGLAARKFASQPHFLAVKDGYNGDLLFRHVFFNGNHECMSRLIKMKERHGYFAYVVRFSLNTRGGLPEPGIINVSFGIRRFLQKGLSSFFDIHPKRNGSILVSLDNPFFQDENSVASYAQLKFRRTKNGQVIWADGVDELFTDLIDVPFQLEEILKNPLAFMEHEQFSALIVYSDLVFTARENLSKALSGIGLPEKWALFDLTKTFFADWKPLEQSKLIHKNFIGKDILPLQHTYPENTLMKVEVWGSKELYQEAINTYLNEQIIFKNGETVYRLNSEPSIDLEFIHKDTMKLKVALDEQHPDKAFMQRVKWLKKKLNARKDHSVITMSLVEIDRKENYKDETDPKHADRIGLAAAERISQFIYPLDTDEKQSEQKARIINSLYDLFSDHGFLPSRISNIKDDIVFLGMGLIQGKVKGKGKTVGFLPVVTKLYKNEMEARLFGGNDWLPLRDALLSASQLEESFLLKRTNDGIEWFRRYQSFFKRAIEQCLYDYESQILIFIEAKLRNAKWSELTNPKLDKYGLPFSLENMNASDRVRVVRVNTTEDVPQYRIHPKGEIKINKNQGLFKDPSGIYYSVGERPDTMQVKKSQQKYHNPNKLLQQQRLVEFIPLGTELEEEREQLAILAHNLRRLNIAYNVHTILPYPLDILKSIKKYIAVLEQDEYQVEDPDSFEDWVFEGEHEQLAFTFSELS